MKKKEIVISLVLLIFIIAIVSFMSLNHVNQRGAINGKVVPTEAGILVNVIRDNKFIAKTEIDSSGIYNISDLLKGTYDLAFISGKKGYYFNGIQVFAGNSTVYNVNLSNFAPEFNGGEILVKFRKGLSQQQKDSIAIIYGCQIKKAENHYDGTYYVLNVTTEDKNLFEIIGLLSSDPNVESATISYIMRITSP